MSLIMKEFVVERVKFAGDNYLLRLLPRGLIDKWPLGAMIACTNDAWQFHAVLHIGGRLTKAERSVS